MRRKAIIEKTAGIIFFICAGAAIFAVSAITLYMIIKGTSALQEVGVSDLLFGIVWKPTAEPPSYGIGYIILSSLIGTGAAIITGVPIGVLSAVFLSEIAGKKPGDLVRNAVELLAAIPSVIYGLIGMMVLNPLMYALEKKIYEGDSEHVYTGGANMLSAVIVLSIMILPTVISVSTSSLKAVPDNLRAASLALGATKEQTIFKTVIPAAKSGILTGVVLGIGRALGEAMAINMVAGGAVNIPLPFNSVRTLTTQIVSEMGYASGLHRQVLYTVGLVLYVFIMIVNFILLKARKGGIKDDNR
ncbi:MAG: phosphate ABC transporter permease subunit PstC [Lachnospiraceae bacterium]|nr:phosphate ABC transporter permease subunit PstC [Lachnospiraceae bacterium]